MSEERTSEKKPQVDIQITGFASGADASQFGGELRQPLINVEMSAENNDTKNITAINQLQKGAMTALSQNQKNIQVTAFEAGAIPPTQGTGTVMQSVLAVTMDSSKSLLSSGRSESWCSHDTSPQSTAETVSAAPFMANFAISGDNGSFTNRGEIFQANTMPHYHIQQIYASAQPKENLPETWRLPRGTVHFTGRQALLEDIEACLSQEGSSQSLVLTACHGLGGVGKTQLALHYAHKHYKKYKGVCFFLTEAKEGLMQSYIDLGDELNLFSVGQKSLPSEKQALIIKGWLENPERAGWLLIYDNAPKYDDISKFLPTKGGNILITSRHIEWPGKTVPIDVFTLEEAREYVKKITNIPNERDNTDELIKTLGRLPLALAQACAYIKKNGITIKEYLELYQEAKRKLLSDKTLPRGDEHEPVIITWNITLKKMQVECPDSVELMYLCAFFYNDNVPEELLESFFLADNATSLKLKCNKAKATAKEYSMIQIGGGKKTFSLHSVVQVVIKLQLKAENKFFIYFRQSTKKLLESYPMSDNRTKALQQKRALLAHLIALLNNLDENTETLNEEKDKEHLELTLAYLSDAYDTLGDAQKQKELLERALIIKEKHYGKDHYEVAKTLTNLGNAYSSLGDAQKQKELLERALSINKKYYDKEHIQVAIVLANLGAAYGILGNAQKQKELLEEALPTFEKYYGKDHYEVASTLMNLGNAYGELGNAQKQKELLEQALPIFEKHYGKDHYYVAIMLTNLGNAYGHLSGAQKKKELLKCALPILKKHYGEDHLQVALVLTNLANAYADLNKAQKSKELLEHALIIKKKYYGENHIEVAKVLTNLGIAYGELGNVQKKKELLERALSIKEEYYVKDHVEIAMMLGNLGNVYGALGNALKGKELLERALTIFEKNYGEDHVEVAKVLTNLANAYCKLNNPQQSKELLERVLKIKGKYYAKDHVEIAMTIGNLGNIYFALGNAQESKELLEHALTIFEKHHGKDHIEVARALTNLANVYGALGNTQKQKELLERALPIKEKYYGKYHVEVANMRQNLVNTSFDIEEYPDVEEERQIQLASALRLSENSQQKILDIFFQSLGYEDLENDLDFKKAIELSKMSSTLPDRSDDSNNNERLIGQTYSIHGMLGKNATQKLGTQAEGQNSGNSSFSVKAKNADEPIKLSSFFEGQDENQCDQKISEFLINGGDINATDPNGNSLLILASGSKGYPSIMQFLLDNGANINHVNNKGETPLHIAVGRQTLSDSYSIAKRQAKVRMLVEKGANPNLPDKGGNTPLSLAKKHSYEGIIELLSKTHENLVSVNKPGGQKN